VRRIAETDGNDVAIGNIISRQRMVKKTHIPWLVLTNHDCSSFLHDFPSKNSSSGRKKTNKK
jgi:hypothetical protein